MSQSESCRVAHCMYVEIELKKKKKKIFLILKVWFYENSVKLWQSPFYVYISTMLYSGDILFWSETPQNEVEKQQTLTDHLCEAQ